MRTAPWALAIGVVATFCVGGRSRQLKTRTGRVLGLTPSGATVAVWYPSGWRRRWLHWTDLTEPTDAELLTFIMTERKNPPREADHIRTLEPRRGAPDA